MEDLPAYSILIVFLLLSIILIFKFKTEHILSVIEGKNFFLLGTLIIIFSLLAFYLFKPNETWVADLLKIAIGIFAGAGAIKGGEKKKGQNSLSLDKSSIKGIGNKFAGRDINESISNIEKTFGDIKDSVINQNNKINQLLNSSCWRERHARAHYHKSFTTTEKLFAQSTSKTLVSLNSISLFATTGKTSTKHEREARASKE